MWEEVDVYPILKDGKTTIPENAMVSMNKNKIALKGMFSLEALISGPLATPIGKGHVSMNLTLRR